MKISVVMPVYNAEKYLRFSVGSVVEAAKRFDGETELICVDDGSTDGSGKMLDEYVDKFKLKVQVQERMFNFKIIHQANAGVSAARNAGLDAATGDLVTFLDADDTYDVRALEILADVRQKSGADIVRYQCNHVHDHSEDAPFEGSATFDLIDVNELTESPIRRCSLGWATLLPLTLASEVRWPSLTHCEDPLFVLRCLRRSPKAAFVRGALANYLVRTDSASHTVSLDIVTATCNYLPLAYDECAAMPGFARSRQDTCAFLAGFVTGPLAHAGRDVDRRDREAAEAAVCEVRNALVRRDPAFAALGCAKPRSWLSSWKRKHKFDLVFALGSGCICTDVLRAAGLQVEAFPMDWVGRQEVTRPIGQVMRDRTDIFISGFKNLLVREQMELDAIAPTDGRHDHYNNVANGQAFFHDFPAGVPLEESFAAVREKYDRRIARFLNRIANARRVLMVWLGDTRDVGRIGHEDIRYALDAFSRKYPMAKFFLRVFECPKEFVPGQEESEAGEDFMVEAFDYRFLGPNAPVWKIRNELVLARLHDCRLRDYRTVPEKLECWHREYEKKRARLHATSWLDMLVVDFQYRMFRHLQKRLTRKGVKLT